MRILFIEDDAMNRRVVRDMLLVGGVEMSEATDAESGLRMLDAQDFDVLLLDLRMPGIDGLTALRMIRERPDSKANLPVIIVTADTAHDLRARCLADGADDLLRKPVAMQSLFDAIGRVLGSRAADGGMSLL